jgi:hypothetical protein
MPTLVYETEDGPVERLVDRDSVRYDADTACWEVRDGPDDAAGVTRIPRERVYRIETVEPAAVAGTSGESDGADDERPPRFVTWPFPYYTGESD